MSKPVIELLLAALTSLALTGALGSALKIRTPNWLWLAFGILPFAFVYLWNPVLRIYSFHGFFHLSIVYQILTNGHIPPHNPLLGDSFLNYPWAHHLIVAAAARYLSIFPSTAFATLNLLALLLSFVAAFKIAGEFSEKRSARILAVCLSILGFSLLNNGPLSALLNDWTHFPLSDGQPKMMGPKFTHVNSMPLGFLFYAFFIYHTLRYFSERPATLSRDLFLVLSAAGTGLFYPQIWLALMANGAAVCAVILIKDRSFMRVLRFGLLLALAALILAPYFHLLSLGREESLITFSGARLIGIKTVRYLCAILPLLPILVLSKDTLWGRSGTPERQKSIIALTLLTSTAVMYGSVSLTAPVYNEYKFLILHNFLLGILGGVALEHLYQKRKAAGLLVMVFLLLPAGADLNKKLDLSRWRTSDPSVVRGVSLYPADPAQDQLYQWIERSTPRDALFIDPTLDLPVFAKRRLFVTFPKELSHLRDGWGAAAENLSVLEGKRTGKAAIRTALVKEIYSEGTAQIFPELARELQESAGDQDLYTVARDPKTASKLSASSAFREVYGGEAGSVYQLIR